MAHHGGVTPDQESPTRPVDVVVIGAGQAGLSAGYHLRRRGFAPVGRAEAGERNFVMLDAEDAPGG
ncbi:FAD-binding protein, partial [Dietzia sp. SLG510A3-30A2]|nr:FAD-binding protein [Dietzia sp. SLG510A3-30A2]